MLSRTRSFPSGENIERYKLESGDEILFSSGRERVNYYVEGIRCKDILTKLVPFNFGKVREISFPEMGKIRAGLWEYFKEQNPETSVSYSEFSVRFLPFFN